ncbi:MAG: SNF2-related protein [Pseudomonadota bacterium]|nr:SNF2-related protein [Pseudomonadota bacterium]
MSAAAQLLDAIVPLVRTRLPAGIDVAYLDDFLGRNRFALEAVIEQNLGPTLRRMEAANRPFGDEDIPELWTASKRTAANVAAMVVASRIYADRRIPSADERAVLAGYSGWGGLSIQAAAGKFPPGFPVPEERGLIHEFYTPTKVTREVARVVAPLVDSLPMDGNSVHALEPSAGIGRFLHAFANVPGLTWHAVEWSELSARMLKALRPDLDLTNAPFERWVREKGAGAAGRLGLVVSNPPYGIRGASIAEDPERAYREKMAYHYFLRRGLDLLAPDGLGVFLIPGGFLTSRTAPFVALREKVLRRHHLAAAFRLPSVRANGREAIFPGAMLVTDLLFFRARGGELDAVDNADAGIVSGGYFKEYPRHILGREVGDDHGEDDQTTKPRWGYQVQGEFTGLPALVERPICGDCKVIAFPSRQAAPGAAGRVGVTRATDADVTDLPRELASAVLLGLRVDRYLALVAAESAEEPPLLWPELHEGLAAWVRANGNPHASIELVKLARGGTTGAERFLSAFDRAGHLIAGLRSKPPAIEPRFAGRADDVVAQAEHLYRHARMLSLGELLDYHASLGGAFAPEHVRAKVLAAGWCLDGDSWNELFPAEVYLSGSLWPKMDRAMARPEDAQAKSQVQRLLEVIKPAIFDDIEGVSARQGWLPLDLVASWVNATYTGYDDVEFVRQGGLVVPRGWQYEELSKKDRELHPEVLLIVGWINHDKTLFSPSKKFDDDNEKDIDKIRMKKAAEWDASFKGWAGATPERRLTIENAYNRQFRGYIAPTYTAEPLAIARWKKDGPRLHAHQVAGARRILANRGGLLAFDVGVGKTYTGIGVLARARQEGWCKRPVVLVPNSIIWKWYADIQRVLPDYRIAVIGSKKKVISRGDRKGFATSDTDTPQERAEKWTRLQAGEYDVVLLTYTALGRTRMNEKAVRAYAEQTEAIQREVALRRRNAAKRKKLSERDEAILREGIAAWVAQQMELADGWEYDPGIAWDDIGVDMLIVDEAQNYKNLYLPEDREGGVPRFMGNPGDGSKRAWQLDFRCAAVRKRTGGTGVVLLSATPAKNSPLEFYNLIQYVDPDAWRRMGIRDPEQFIDRYLRIEIKAVVTPSMEVEERGAVVGFQNLHELRDTILRYGEFKTAEDVGLKLPDPKVEMVEVDMDAGQDAKYDRYVREIEAALKSDDPSDKAKILGLLARMALVAIHAELDEGYSWKNADQVSNAGSPKFEALAERVLANRTCGHIVFVENVAAHRWITETLVSAGIVRDRIGVLNAVVAPNAADRQRIAKEFNGDAETESLPKFDVVIANQIAYEGIDLQTRTCAIHHLDLPWEPATLQQRNGRGVRQGNTLSAIAIYYYFARRSQDGLRFNLIQGKRGWMTQLLKSQDRDTNNPGAQMDMGPEEILLLISRNPEQTRARLEAVRAQREAEAKKKIATEASKLLRAINARFRNAERTRDGIEAARLRGEAEERLKHLSRVNVEAWPWASASVVVRENPVLVPEGGGPLYEGLHVGIPSAWNASKVDYVEFGKVTKDGQIAARAAGEASWRLFKGDDTRFATLKPEHYGANFPVDEEPAAVRAVGQIATDRLRYSGDWPGVGWHSAPDHWVERVWPQVAELVVGALSKVSYYNAQSQKVPVVAPAGLRVVNGAAASGTAGVTVLPPTEAGWQAFLAQAPGSGLKFGELAEAGRWWWGRTIPRNLLSAEEGYEADDIGQGAA